MQIRNHKKCFFSFQASRQDFENAWQKSAMRKVEITTGGGVNFGAKHAQGGGPGGGIARKLKNGPYYERLNGPKFALKWWSDRQL